MRRVAGLLLITSCVIGFATPARAQASSGIVLGLWPQNYNAAGGNASQSFVSIRNASGITIPYYRSRMNAGQYGAQIATNDGDAAAAAGLSLGLNIQPKSGSGNDRAPITYQAIMNDIAAGPGHPYYDWLKGYADEIKALPTYGVVPNYIQFHSEANVQGPSPDAQPYMGSVGQPWTSGPMPMSYQALAAEYVQCYTMIHNLFTSLGVTNKIYWQIVLTQAPFNQASAQGGAAIWFPSDPSLYDYVGVDGYYKAAKANQSAAWMQPSVMFGQALAFARARGKQLWIDEVGADEGGPSGTAQAKADWFGQLNTYLQANVNDIAGVVFSSASDGGDWYLDSIYPTGANNNARANPVFSGTSWNGWKAAVTALSGARYTGALSVSAGGSGSGSVTSTPSGIACPPDCSESLHQGDIVHLVASADAGSSFTGWSGDCSGSSTSCDVTIGAASSVTATFQALHSLSVSVGGTGSVTSDVDGIDCPSSCSAAGLLHGSHVVLTASPGPGSVLQGWSGGGCAGTSTTCDVTMDGDASITASFAGATALSVAVAGDGTGSVSSSPGGIDCPDTCDATFQTDADVTLTATADADAIFTGWSSADPGFNCPGTADCTVTMDGARSVTATFAKTWVLHVQRVGPAPGIVSSDIGGIDCGTACDAAIVDGTDVTLHAADGAHSTFVGWGGDCAGTDDCVVAMDRARSVVATYTANVFSLAVTTTGAGTGEVTSDDPGIDCPDASCTSAFAEGTTVTLQASADASTSVFAGWSGDCNGTDDCVVTMDGAHAVTASFVPAQRLLTVAADGTGAGSVTSDDGQIDCPGACGQTYDHGTVLQLVATPGTNAVFTGWSGACSGTDDCQVTMNAARNVTATFSLVPRALTVTSSGNGSGSVSSSPAGISCPSTCSADFDHGTVVQLSASPAAGSSFAGWGGACTGTGSCQVTMDAARSVTATYTLVSRTLTVTPSGTGAGSVTSSPAGVNCPAACSAGFDHGTVVQLTATPGTNAVFAGWGGACSGTGTCQVTMSADASVTATFAPAPRTLTVAVTGPGSVSSSPLGIACPSACSAGFDHGTVVQLTATPGANAGFTGWSGACSGTGTCQVTMDAAKSVTATFALLPRQLTVGVAGSGTGSVGSSPAGISCPSTCSASFPHGTVVQLTATPGANAAFTGWSGACSGTGTCQVTMDAAKSVTATFTLVPRQLTVTIAGSGTGSVGSSPAGVSCPSTCSATFPNGTVVQLTATPGTGGMTFTGWSGGCSGTGACQVTMTAAIAVTATFAKPPTVLGDNDPTLSFDGWAGVTDPTAADGFVRDSNVKNDTLTWKSPPTTSIKWVTRFGPDQGKASVTIDGNGKGTFDLYQATRASKTISFNGLANKAHTIVITVLHTKNNASSGYHVQLESFIVGTTTRSSDPAIAYDDWTSTTANGATNGTYRSSGTADATLTIRFTGTSIDWLGALGPAFGKASVKIDGGAATTIDLYKVAPVSWQTVRTFGGLTAGTHTLTITVLGQKNTKSSGKTVVVDGFVVRG